MDFEAAVKQAAAPLSAAFRDGKQALKHEHRTLVTCKRGKIVGSIDIDGTLAREPEHRDAPRWDYGLGYRAPNDSNCALWVEVHPASTSNVAEVIAKLRWLRGYLASNAASLLKLSRAASPKPFVWIATEAGVHMTPNSPQARRLRLEGLDMPRRRLELP